LVVSKEDLERCEQEIVKALGFQKVRRLVAGGKTRQESVYQGLIHSDPVSEMILVHDGVRPFLTQDILHRCIESAVVYGGAVVAIPITETVKQVGPEGIIKGTVDRNTLWRAQTPQVFRRSLLEQAYQQARSDCFDGTDDASLVERLGVTIRVVEGSPENIKITTQEDLALAEFLFRRVKGRVPISS
jgi:2-C-methyl-D-erythritol 4-phosphate cytidylyltransferase